MIGRDDGRHARYMNRDESELPTLHSRAVSAPMEDDSNPLLAYHKEKKTPSPHRAKRASSVRQWLMQRRLTVFAVVAAFLLGYYAQLLVFFFHVRLGFTGAILPTSEVSLGAKLTQALIEQTKHVIFVCRKTNWDFVGFMATPHTVLFAHEDVMIPAPLDNTLSVVRHTGVDSYMNLHNKTITIMSHVHRANKQHHFMKQDDEAVMYWPHYYQCLQKCKDLSTCYAGDMHVNVGDAGNSNSYVFATGGSYFLGNDLLRCILDKPVYVRLDGLDFGEDKTVGKMIHYNKCDVQYVSCKWFNNKEVYSPHALVRMTKGATKRYILEDTVLLSEAELKEAAASDQKTSDGAHAP